jgi:uncharacterized protein YfiM (DUF2279 family)
MKQNLLKGVVLTLGASLLAACGGGGGGTSGGGYTPGPIVIVQGPYETVYGANCAGQEVTPGCTFVVSTGNRATVSLDPNYDRYGYGSDDLWFVKFDSSGRASVYDDLGSFQYYANISEFAGYVGGTTIGVGTTGIYWENVSNRTYWFGKNGVLFNANPGSSKFGEAINTKDAKYASDVNSKAIKSEVNQKLIKSGASKLQKEYGLSASKALGVASALNAWAVAGAERGKITTRDMDLTVKAVFGVEFKDALAAFRDFQAGDSAAARELTNRSASALGLKPDQAKEFIKGMYKSTLNQMGINAADINW